jgi:hypothetical protein
MQPFLLRGATEQDLGALDEQQIADRWLGYEPATVQMLAEAEERLGAAEPARLPADQQRLNPNR